MEITSNLTGCQYFVPSSSPNYQSISPPSTVSYNSENSLSPSGHETYSYTQLEAYNPLNQGVMSFNSANLSGNANPDMPISTTTFASEYIENNPSYASSNLYHNDAFINRDEGIGSSPSSLESTSPPIMLSEHQHVQPAAAPIFNNMHELSRFYSESGLVLMENLPSDPLIFSVPSRQCVRCGNSSSMGGAWFPDDTGHFLCHLCHGQSMAVASRCITPTRDVEKSKKSSPSKQRRRQMGSAKKPDQKCSNCGTETTSLWRRNRNGEAVCNACGLYHGLKNVNRPLTMRKDVIQRRKRKPRTDSSKKKTKADVKNPVPNASLPFVPPASCNESYGNAGFSGAQHAGHSVAAQNIVRLPSLNVSIGSALYNHSASVTTMMHH